MKLAKAAYRITAWTGDGIDYRQLSWHIAALTPGNAIRVIRRGMPEVREWNFRVEEL